MPHCLFGSKDMERDVAVLLPNQRRCVSSSIDPWNAKAGLWFCCHADTFQDVNISYEDHSSTRPDNML